MVYFAQISDPTRNEVKRRSNSMQLHPGHSNLWPGWSCIELGLNFFHFLTRWVWCLCKMDTRNEPWASVIIRPQRSTTYENAAYCYRPSSVVCRSVCRSVTLVSSAKTAAPIELPFGLRTWVDPGNHVLDEVQIPTWKGANFWGRMGIPL